MVEHNKYDVESNVISNLVYSLALSEQHQEFANGEMYFILIYFDSPFRLLFSKQNIMVCLKYLFVFIHQSSHQTCPSNTFAENVTSSETNVGTNVQTYQSHDGEENIENAVTAPDGNQSDVTKGAMETNTEELSSKQTVQNENEERKLWNHSMKPSSTYLQLASRPRQKCV